MKTRNKRQSSEQCDEKKNNEEEHKLLRAKKSEQNEGKVGVRVRERGAEREHKAVEC